MLKLWTVPEVAALLRKSKDWVYKAVECGGLPHRKIGRAVRFVPSEMQVWLDRQGGSDAKAGSPGTGE